MFKHAARREKFAKTGATNATRLCAILSCARCVTLVRRANAGLFGIGNLHVFGGFWYCEEYRQKNSAAKVLIKTVPGDRDFEFSCA